MNWIPDNPNDLRVLRQVDIDFIIYSMCFLAGSTYDDEMFERARVMIDYLEETH